MMIAGRRERSSPPLRPEDGRPPMSVAVPLVSAVVDVFCVPLVIPTADVVLSVPLVVTVAVNAVRVPPTISTVIVVPAVPPATAAVEVVRVALVLSAVDVVVLVVLVELGSGAGGHTSGAPAPGEQYGSLVLLVDDFWAVHPGRQQMLEPREKLEMTQEGSAHVGAERTTEEHVLAFVR